ncbi:CPBP family glutamic-type intramembrane protease [Spirillospora sp. NPDC048819]|uniref:CPBP family glutamic-type intramembrane protease n=1 Tax=Spirillospora sp. NPDC048819 TaxID=3155268 RepID=UPI0033C9382C
MSEPGDADGWAPLDPDLSGDRPRPAEPPPREPYSQEDRPPYGPPPEQAQQPYTAGMPYWPGAPAQPPGWDQQYGAAPYGQAYPGYPGYGAQPVRTSWTVAAPAGSPFHRLARNGSHRWWRPLVGSLAIAGIGLSLAMGLMLAGMIIRVVVTGELPETTGADPNTIFGDDTADLAFNLAALAVFLPVAVFAAWGIQRRRPGTLSSVAGRLRWKWMLVCCGLAILFCIVAYGTSLLAAVGMDDQSGGDEHWVGWDKFLVPAIVIILLVPFQAAAEEYVFRGWVLQAVGACTLENARGRVGQPFSVVFRTPWPGIVIGSALFTAGHGYTGWGILDIFVFGAIAAWLAVRTGGLEASIALHVFNNLLAFLGSATIGQLDIEQGGVPWQVVVADIVPMVLFAAAAVWLARRMRVQTVTADPTDSAGSTDPAGPTDSAADDVPVTADSPPAHAS